MSNTGDCYDNAMMESFWFSLEKKSVVDTKYFPVVNEAKTALFDTFEVYYNRKRRHSSLGYVSPVPYEKQEKEKNT